MSETIKETIVRLFQKALAAKNIIVPIDFFESDFVLLESGLDSLGFALLVVALEEELQFDPFIATDTPVYPKTFYEFVDFYENFQ